MSRTNVLTGRGMALIAGIAFGLVLAVNILLAVIAVRTFSGVVVDDSYIASRSFDTERNAQIALGWRLEIIADSSGLQLDVVDASGRPVRPASLHVTVGRPSTDQQDRSPSIEETARGYAASVPLAAGAWRVDVSAVAMDGTAFRQSREIYIEAGS